MIGYLVNPIFDWILYCGFLKLSTSFIFKYGSHKSPKFVLYVLCIGFLKSAGKRLAIYAKYMN